MSEQIEDHVRYRPLCRAIQENDWKGVEGFISKLDITKELTAKIKLYEEETIFHVLTLNLEVPIWLMEKLASMVEPELLEQLTDKYGRSTIFSAALLGNTNAAKALVRRNKDLPNIRDSEGILPIHLAATRGHEQVIRYLLSVTTESLDDKHGVPLLQDLIKSGLYGIALDLLKRYPTLARERYQDRGSILLLLANKPLAFQSGSRLGYWKRLVYKWIPVQEEGIPRTDQNRGGDVENPFHSKNKKFTRLGFLRPISTTFDALHRKLHITLWNALMLLIPVLKHIRETKLMHMQTIEMVKIMCHEGIIWSHDQAKESLRMPVLTAATLGIYEFVDQVLKAHFYSFVFADKNRDDIFRHAILHRHEKVFNLVTRKNILLTWDRDMKRVADMTVKADNILHFAGRLVPSSQVSGAALQMQRELQWFKAVSSFVHPSRQEQRNEFNKTPREVFTEEHANLVKEGEKWMKETASSCTVVAALIITVLFAAAFTVPGGNDSTKGIPIFLHKPSFIVFVISDAIALFSSTSSLLMFLAILTSRYAEEDFLESLPKKLIVGFITLFFSIACMMVAFGTTIYIFLSHPWKWTIIPISLLGCLPVTLFALLQFPLLVELFSSTYRPAILQPRK